MHVVDLAHFKILIVVGTLGLSDTGRRQIFRYS
jgi:hypothetical protein